MLCGHGIWTGAWDGPAESNALNRTLATAGVFRRELLVSGILGCALDDVTITAGMTIIEIVSNSMTCARVFDLVLNFFQFFLYGFGTCVIAPLVGARLGKVSPLAITGRDKKNSERDCSIKPESLDSPKQIKRHRQILPKNVQESLTLTHPPKPKRKQVVRSCCGVTTTCFGIVSLTPLRPLNWSLGAIFSGNEPPHFHASKFRRESLLDLVIPELAGLSIPVWSDSGVFPETLRKMVGSGTNPE